MEISGLEGYWGVNYSVEACSHCVKVGLVVFLLKRELTHMATITWSMWVIPEDLGNFSPPKRRKILGSKNSRLSASSFGSRPLVNVAISKVWNIYDTFQAFIFGDHSVYNHGHLIKIFN